MHVDPSGLICLKLKGTCKNGESNVIDQTKANLSMASQIVTSKEATFGQRLGASAYIGAASFAGASLAVGGAILAGASAAAVAPAVVAGASSVASAATLGEAAFAGATATGIVASTAASTPLGTLAAGVGQRAGGVLISKPTSCFQFIQAAPHANYFSIPERVLTRVTIPHINFALPQDDDQVWW
jgi:hypothetical protein